MVQIVSAKKIGRFSTMKLATNFMCMAIATLGLFSGCSPDEIIPPGNTPVVLQLNWTPDPTFSGAYIAADRGKNFFAQQGLSVDIQAGGFGIDPFAPVVAKSAQFAVVGADKAAIAFSNGAPIRVVAVEFQRNPVGWIVRRSLGVNAIPDLLSRPDLILGDKIGTETTIILSLMLSKLKIEDKIIPQGVGFELAYFIQNVNVVYPVYLNQEPVTAKMMGLDVVEIDPSKPENGGIRLYGNVIIVHEDTLNENPRLVTAFVAGLRKGWEFAAANPDAAITLLQQYTGFENKEMAEVLARSVEFATSSYGVRVPPGHMEVSQWQNTLRVLRDSGALEKDISVSDLVWFGGIN